MDPSRAPVAFGRLAVPQLFAELRKPEEARRLPALASLCDLLHDPELFHQTLKGGSASPGSSFHLACELLKCHIHSSEEIRTMQFKTMFTFPPELRGKRLWGHFHVVPHV